MRIYNIFNHMNKTQCINVSTSEIKCKCHGEKAFSK